jgi:hypothetical protein
MSENSSMPQGTVDPLGSTSGHGTAHNPERLQASYPGCPTFNDYNVAAVTKLRLDMAQGSCLPSDQAEIQEYYGFAESLGTPYNGAPNISPLSRPFVEKPDGSTFTLPSSYIPVLVPPSSMTPVSDNDVEGEGGEVLANTVTRNFIDNKTSRPPFSGPGNPKNPNVVIDRLNREAARRAADADQRDNEVRPNS